MFSLANEVSVKYFICTIASIRLDLPLAFAPYKTETGLIFRFLSASINAADGIVDVSFKEERTIERFASSRKDLKFLTEKLTNINDGFCRLSANLVNKLVFR